MRHPAHRTFCAFTLTTTIVIWAGCSGSTDVPGQSGTGGASTSTGGAVSTSGGMTTGGQVSQPATGGVTTGGQVSQPATGGAPISSGGQLATGGTASPTGGATGDGGRGGTAGGSSQGGATPGGKSNTGGSPTGGKGGATTGGAKGDAGATSTGGAAGSGTTGEAAPSAGCGKAAGIVSGKATIDAGGKTREYIIAVPDNYDQNHPYKLIFGWHPWGGSAQQVASGGYYGLVNQAKGSAIFVAGEGLDFGGNGKGWGNTNGEDIALLNAMLERFRSQLCIDENRIFSTGFSFGGMFSFAAGCSAMGMMRAVAPMAGNTSVAGCENGTRPVALMGFHGTDDTVVAIDGGRKGRDAFAKRNGCTDQTMPSMPTWCDVAGANYQPCSCVSYQGCKAGYPVTWCEYKAGHMPAPNSAATLWTFFSQF